MRDFWLLVGDNAMGHFSIGTVILFFAAAIVLLLVLKKTGLLYRPNRWHALLVKVYYLYIPVVFLALGFMWATVSSLENAFLTACEQSRPAIIESSVEKSRAVLEDVEEHLPADKPASLKEVTTAVTRDYIEKYTEGTAISNYFALLQPMIAPLQERFATALAGGVEEIIVSKIADVSRLQPQTVRNIWQMDIVEALQGGLAVEILMDQIRATFPPYYKHIKMLGLILLLPVMLEIAVSALVIRARVRKAREQGTVEAA